MMKIPFSTPWWRNCLIASAGLAAVSLIAVQAQPPRGERGGSSSGAVEAAINRLLEFDADGDGKLSRTELSDARLQALFQRADADKDGSLTRSELSAQLTKDAAAIPVPQRGAGLGPGPGTPGGRGPEGGAPGGPDDRGPGARGPQPGGPGQILPPFLQDDLNLTEAQRRQLQELQADVDARLAKILTPAQLQQLRQMRSRGPGPGGPPGAAPGGLPGSTPPRR